MRDLTMQEVLVAHEEAVRLKLSRNRAAEGVEYWKSRADALAAENARLREALSDCADDLAAELRARYPVESHVYPSIHADFVRDMEPVERARALLNAEASDA